MLRTNRGLTLVELVIILGIIALLGLAIFTTTTRNAHGSEDFEVVYADDANIEFVADQLKKDPSLKVHVLTYMVKWTHEGSDVHIDQAQMVEAKLRSHGVKKDRIIPFYANKDGMALDQEPNNDGVYLLLTH